MLEAVDISCYAHLLPEKKLCQGTFRVPGDTKKSCRLTTWSHEMQY